MSADLQQQPEAPQQPTPDVVEQDPSAQSPDPAPPETTADAKPQENVDEGDKKARRQLNNIQKRIDELTREKHEARRDAEAARERTAQLESEFRKVQGAAPEPKLENFKSYDEFVDAKATWKAETIVAAKLEEFANKNLQTFEQRAQQEQRAQVAQQFDRALEAVEKDGVARFKDFADVIAQGPALGPVIGQMVLATERPADITYYLAKNPDEAMNLKALPPILAMREIGKLEAQLSQKRVTSAPPPPRTLGGSDKSSPVGLSDELPPGEWYKRRQAQLNRKS